MRYVAFLRAINVGGHVVTMERLRALFEGLNFARVETVIASGNVMFDAPARTDRALERRIATHLGEALGYPVATFVRTLPELAALLESPAFRERFARAGETFYVCFLAAPPSPADARRIQAAGTDTDSFLLDGRELYWVIKQSYSKSTFGGPRLEKLLGVQTTVRNARTIERIVARARC